MAKDLVCNMDVDEKTAKWKTVYKGKTYSTQPVKIKVTPPAQNRQMTPPQSSPSGRAPKQAQAGEDFFIEQSVDRTRPYVGQQVTMIFRFYQGQNLYEQPTLRWPDYNGFWVEDLPPQKTYNKYINGRSYRVTEIRKALFPTVTGKLQIDPTVLRAGRGRVSTLGERHRARADRSG